MSRNALKGRRRPGRWSLATPAALLLAGCGGNRDATPKVSTYEVKGQVLLADGKPLTQGRVTFVPKHEPALQAVGEIGPDGAFSLSTVKEDDGAVPGDYKVRIEPAASDVVPLKSKRALKFPVKYEDEDAAELPVTVKSEPNQLAPFRLK